MYREFLRERKLSRISHVNSIFKQLDTALVGVVLVGVVHWVTIRYRWVTIRYRTSGRGALGYRKFTKVFSTNIYFQVICESSLHKSSPIYTVLQLPYTALTLQKPRMVTVLQPFQPRLHYSLKTLISSKPRMRRKNRHVHAVRPRIHVCTYVRTEKYN